MKKLLVLCLCLGLLTGCGKEKVKTFGELTYSRAYEIAELEVGILMDKVLVGEAKEYKDEIVKEYAMELCIEMANHPDETSFMHEVDFQGRTYVIDIEIY